jgi:general secretion pathway protein D
MHHPPHLRVALYKVRFARAVALTLPFLCMAVFSLAQTPADNPASVPAGAIEPVHTRPAAAPAKGTKPVISAKQARQADDAYLEGAKEIQRKNTVAAERDFARAAELNPQDRDYALALVVTRETHLSELVASAAKARALGDNAHADALLAEARVLDPTNPIVAQHFEDTTIGSAPKPPDNIGATLGGPIELAPNPGTHDFHLSGDPQSIIRQVYSAYGIDVVFDPTVTSGAPLKFDFDAITFADASRILASLTHIFAVPVQPKSALIAKDTQENRDNLQPLIEETIYLPGLSQEQMTELANVARNVFDVKQVTASPTGGFMLLRGEERLLNQLNATYADILDGGSEVLFDVKLYELDRTYTKQLGAQLPASANVFSLTQAAQNLISANQTLIQEAITSGALTLTSNAAENELLELEVLVAAQVSGSSEFTDLLAVLGHFDGLPLAGLSLASSSTFNLLLASSDVRILDDVQLRSSNHQDASFKAGSRYPIVTATYSGGVSSALSSQLAGLTINGQSAASLLAQYLGSSSSLTVPQFQYEDLGITLKMTPSILHSTEVQVKLDMKIEALAGSSINSIPILDNRAFTSTITVPAGQTAMLATLVNTDEVKSLDGLPGLSELPGFQGTDQNVEKDSTELLITITPHIVRSGSLHIASRRLASPHTGNNATTQ